MNNFTFKNPTKILFGKGRIADIAAEIPTEAKILVLFGGGSITKNGVLNQVRTALRSHNVTEFGGIEPNPQFSTLMKAVNIVKENGITFLLAVGGGSVLDGTKFVAAAAKLEVDCWNILKGSAPVVDALPLASILTLSGTGSEMNGAAVISRNETGEKLAFISPLVYPVFSVLDPETTYSVPSNQIGNGVVDAFSHVVEQYMTYPVDSPLQDRMAEAVLKTLIEVGPVTQQNPTDYNARANFMWAATMALNGIISVGLPQDWATHAIGHELTALHGIDHARTLATIMPQVLRNQKQAKKAKLIQFAERVWNIHTGSEDEKIEAGIQKMEEFFNYMGLPTKLSNYSVDQAAADKVVANLLRQGEIRLGESGQIGSNEVYEIVKSAI